MIVLERFLDATLNEANNSATPEQAPEQFLKKICKIYNLRHASYITADKRTLKARKPKFCVTYPIEWQEEYRRSFSDLRDPVLKFGIQSMVPFDWREPKVESMDADNLFGAAREFGLGEHGISFPIRDNDDVKGILSLTGDYSRKDWLDLTNCFTRDFTILGRFIQKQLVDEVEKKTIVLSPRQKQALSLYAIGNSIEKIANELSITTPAVKYHLNNARHKLNAVNSTHAAVMASKLGLILES